MVVRVSVLGSCSKANSTLVQFGEDALLVDAGFSCRETLRRIALVPGGPSPDGIRAICLTHEHCDHVSGLRVLQKTLHVPAYATSETARAADPHGLVEWQYTTPASAFLVGPFRVTPFRVPHDAYDPVGYRIECGGLAVGIATDLGMATGVVRNHLANCDIVVLEANHEPSLLRSSGRPPRLIQRILANHGHLSNDACADLLAELCAVRSPRHVLLAHLSQECNRPETAKYTVYRRLLDAGFASVQVHLTNPDTPTTVELPSRFPP